MEYLKLTEENKDSSKRDCRLSIAKNQKASVKCNLLEAIAQVHGGGGGGGGGAVSRTDENGVVRVKIVVSKQELKQLLAMMEGGKNTDIKSTTKTHQGSSPTMSLSLEQRLHFLRKKNLRRTDQHVKGSRRTWRPALQSIPEEL